MSRQTIARRRPWGSLICRLRGHKWQTAESTGYHPDGRLFVRGTQRLCLRCPARDGR